MTPVADPSPGPAPHHALSRSRAAWRRTAILVFVAACLLPSGGCYTYHVYRIGGAADREMGNQPSTEWQGRTLHALLWGLVRQDLPVENCPTVAGYRTGIEEVKVETNLAYLLAATATLGIWVPLEVSWRCARPPVPSGVLREDRP